MAIVNINDKQFTYNLGTSATSAVSTDSTSVEKLITVLVNDSTNISLLEKINRLTELQDPDLIPLQLISFLSNNLGYSVDVNREDLVYTGDLGNLAAYEDSTLSAVDSGKYLRFMIANLPNWYKIKTTKNAIKVLLFSFGVIGDIREYYTSNYGTGVSGTWILNELDSVIKIPDNYYPTPHFAIYVSIDETIGEVSKDSDRRMKVIRAIQSIKPINTVFKNFTGYFERSLPTINVSMRMRMRTNIVIK